MTVKFISSVIFVKDIQVSRQFYEVVLGQKVDIDFGLSVGYVGGFSIWQIDHATQTIDGSSAGVRHSSGSGNYELCFEADDLDQVLARVTQANTAFVHPILEQSWGQRVFRICDPDGYMLEIGEPMTAVIQRLLSDGMPVDDVVRRTAMPYEMVAAVARTSA
jgi:catechol 2,3-dioxygenase-like lactoylglutathione lyase family enzyme